MCAAHVSICDLDSGEHLCVLGNFRHSPALLDENTSGQRWLPVKWMMMPADDFRMWNCYRKEAPARHWPLWPFYAYRFIMTVFVITGVFLLANTGKLEPLLR